MKHEDENVYKPETKFPYKQMKQDRRRLEDTLREENKFLQDMIIKKDDEVKNQKAWRVIDALLLTLGGILLFFFIR